MRARTASAFHRRGHFLEPIQALRLLAFDKDSSPGNIRSSQIELAQVPRARAARRTAWRGGLSYVGKAETGRARRARGRLRHGAICPVDGFSS